jgi:hypothetical protein
MKLHGILTYKLENLEKKTHFKVPQNSRNSLAVRC